MNSLSIIGDLCRRGIHDRRGAAALEFAILGPLMILTLAAVADIGIASVLRLRMTGSVSSAIASVLTGGGSVSSATIDPLAASLATVLLSSDSAGTFTILLNGDRTYTYQGSQRTSSGMTSSADTCRCPVVAATVISWGSVINCGATCPDGSLSGKYISIQYTKAYTSLFAQYGFIQPGGIRVRTFARIQ